MSPELPVYCSNLMYVGLSLMKAFCAWVAPVNAKSREEISAVCVIFMMISLIEQKKIDDGR